MRRITSLCLLAAAFCLLAASCQDDGSPAEVQPVVEVSLEAGEDIRSVSDAVVALNCRTENGTVRVLADKTADGCYEAALPTRCFPADDFIEVSLDGATYGYTPSETCLEGGRAYRYSLVLTADGLQEAGNVTTIIGEWADGGHYEGVAN